MNLLLTDPPYNVALGSNSSVDPARSKHLRDDGVAIANDDMAEADYIAFLGAAFFRARAMMKPGAPFYVWHAEGHRRENELALKSAGFNTHQVLVWNKNHFTIGWQDYHWKHEPCLYGWLEGAAHYWNGGSDKSTVLDYERPQRNDEHPTMKPIALFDRLIRNSCPPDGVVYDPFGGSGTTLLACEQNGRTCWMCELEPRFVAVIIDRWEKLTGQKAEKIN